MTAWETHRDGLGGRLGPLSSLAVTMNGALGTRDDEIQMERDRVTHSQGHPVKCPNGWQVQLYRAPHSFNHKGDPPAPLDRGTPFLTPALQGAPWHVLTKYLTYSAPLVPSTT